LRMWLKEARYKKGLERRDVASAVGITVAGYGCIENGKTTPKPDTAKKIAKVLGVRPEQFVEANEA